MKDIKFIPGVNRIKQGGLMLQREFFHAIQIRRRLLEATTLNRRLCCMALMGAGALSLAPTHFARAYSIYSNGNVTVNLNTTLEYSSELRVNNPSQVILNEANHNDGDQNFKHGFVANQFQGITALSVVDGNYGLHISGQAYIDPSYLQKNQNTSPYTVNSNVVNNRDFASGTKNIDGKYAQILDAFVYGSHDFGQQVVTLKVGRQTLLWGQSLFFTNDSIAAGQAPINVNEALSLANPEAQQVFMPIGQAVLTYQPTQWLTLQGYYQFQWQSDLFPGVGSYFSPVDFVGTGGDRLIAGPAIFPNGAQFGSIYLSNAGFVTPPSQNGRFGLSAQFQVGNYDFGIYGLRFDDQSPQFYIHEYTVPKISVGGVAPGVAVGTLTTVYARDIYIYGASFSTDVGPVQLAGEMSVRTHQDLFSNPVDLGTSNSLSYNENGNPGYAVGNTLDAQASAIYLTPALPLMPGGASIVGEVEANRVMAVTANKSDLVPGRTPNAMGITGVFTPTYYDVLPNVNVNFPIGVTWYPTGRSEFDQSESAGTGSLNIGVTANYKQVWYAGLNYADFLGSTSVTPTGASKQVFADRGYLSFFIQRSF